MKNLGTIALIAAAGVGVYLYVRSRGQGTPLAGKSPAPASQFAWTGTPKLTGWSLLDPTIKGSPGQMAVGLFASTNVRDD